MSSAPDPHSAVPVLGALTGVKVIDLSRVLGGPFATQLLADHGADVVKLEPPQGDEVRDWGPPFYGEDAAYFVGINRNKRSVGLDLTRPEGREVLLSLLDDADVLIENFKPGSMEKWGIGYDSLKARFPRLIYCKISGFGNDGPYGGYPAMTVSLGRWPVITASIERFSAGVADMRSRVEAQGRDPERVEVALFAPWATVGKASIRDGERVAFTGAAAQVLADVAAFEDAGLDVLVVALAAPAADAMVERCEAFAEAVGM